jgi:hypothetical protein
MAALLFENVVDIQEAVQPPPPSLDQEIATYKAIPVVQHPVPLISIPEMHIRMADPLLWWKKNKDCFPLRYSVAHVVHAIPASGIECERLFSLTGLIMSHLRASMKTETLNMSILASYYISRTSAEKAVGNN